MMAKTRKKGDDTVTGVAGNKGIAAGTAKLANGTNRPSKKPKAPSKRKGY
jgi:hypothetical protein